MNKQEYTNIFQQEESHFFYVTNHNIVLSLFKKYKQKGTLKILDAGCGTGLLAQKMQLFGDVQGIDFMKEAVNFSKKRGVNVQQASVTNIPFADNTFDVVTCIDVINHSAVGDDKLALKEFYRVLKPNGILILRVSAHPWIKLNHDKHVQVIHRYSKKELIQKLEENHFNPLKVSYVNMILLPLAILRHIKEKIIPPTATDSLVSEVPPFLNTILLIFLKPEAWLIKKFNLPIGLGLITVSKKK